MNTMKREDMLVEQGQLVNRIGFEVIRALNPLAQVLAMIGRVTFLENEIQKVAAKQKQEKVEGKNDKMDLKEESNQGAERAEAVAAGS